MAAVPNFLRARIPRPRHPLVEDLCDGDKPFIENGWMAVSDKPGIGVELNDEVAKTLLWNGDTLF